MHESPVLAVGRFNDEVARSIREAATSVGLTARFVPDGEDVLAAPDTDPSAVVLPMNTPGAAETCTLLRRQTRFAGVPVVGVTARRQDMAFIDLFALGGDDLVGLRVSEALARRLRPLAGRTSSPATVRSGGAGVALVASPDTRWRSVVGRGLHAGGYAVHFVTDVDELVEASLAGNVAVVVVADDLAAGGAVSIAASARARGSKAAWIVVSPPKRMAAVHAAAAEVPRTAAVDGYAPPENVLFRANELVARPAPDQRAAPRLLYGTSVLFRGAGHDEDEVGFSYNVSSGGVYVRTLAPLDPGQEVWLDMWAPRSQRRVRLAGLVAWRRTFGASEKATVPPGFGVKIVDGLAKDLERWREGCEAFAKDMFGEAVA
ncbi:MAG TPA: PilZ domain-containing protein [Polyangiaceae bacterium]|jgi:DNA-binding response OmpR family regulator/Tfp pilus assembly protein PilZ